MTEADFDRGIAAQQQAIKLYQSEVGDLEDKIRKLKEATEKVEEAKIRLTNYKNNALVSISEITHVRSSVINSKFFNNLKEVIAGEPYKNSVNALESIIQKISDKINELCRQINQIQLSISQCNQSINNLQSEKQAYLIAQSETVNSSTSEIIA